MDFRVNLKGKHVSFSVCTQQSAEVRVWADFPFFALKEEIEVPWRRSTTEGFILISVSLEVSRDQCKLQPIGLRWDVRPVRIQTSILRCTWRHSVFGCGHLVWAIEGKGSAARTTGP